MSITLGTISEYVSQNLSNMLSLTKSLKTPGIFTTRYKIIFDAWLASVYFQYKMVFEIFLCAQKIKHAK